MNKEEVKKLREHCEKQISLSYALGDIKHASEHELVLKILDYIDQQDQIIREARGKLSFIDKALEEDTLNTMLCITKINKAIEILDRNVK